MSLSLFISDPLFTLNMGLNVFSGVALHFFKKQLGLFNEWSQVSFCLILL